MKYLLSEDWYKVLKWCVLIVLPALATLVSALGSAWGFDVGLINAICTSITAIATFFGALIGVSQATAKPDEDVSDDE